MADPAQENNKALEDLTKAVEKLTEAELKQIEKMYGADAAKLFRQQQMASGGGLQRQYGEYLAQREAVETKRAGEWLHRQREQAETTRRRHGERAAVNEAAETRRIGEQFRKQREQAEAKQRRQGEQAAVDEARKVQQAGDYLRRQREQHAKEQLRQQREGPLPELVKELSSRQQALHDYYQNNPKASPDSLAAKALHKQVAEQEGYVANKYAGLSPQEQSQQNPLMQRLEFQKQMIEEEELRRRRKLVDVLGKENDTLTKFSHGALAAAGIGAISSPFALGASAVALWQYGQMEKQRGLAAINPGITRTADVSEKLEEGAYASLQGYDRAERARARRDQAAAALEFEGARRRKGRGETGWFEGLQERYYNWRTSRFESGLREAGLLREGEHFRAKEDIHIPVHSRITTPEEFGLGLAPTALESGSQEASNELMVRQLEQAVGYLRQIAGDRRGGLDAPAFGA